MSGYDSTADTKAHIDEVGTLLSEASDSLLRRAALHDRSKLHSPEKEIFDEFTPKLRATTYGSDEYKEFLARMKVALDHHYAVNSHHPEHYRWRCGVCRRSFSDQQAPAEPDHEGRRFCPNCLPPGASIIYECELFEEVKYGIRGMNLLDLLEMFCDWTAATKRHADGDIRKSIKLNQKRFGYSDDLKQILLNTVENLK